MVQPPAPGSAVTVVGCGRSGLAATQLLRAHGVIVTAVDDAPREQIADRVAAIEALGARCLTGCTPDEPLPQADVIVVSPGVSTRSPRFKRAVALGSLLVSEPAFASWYCPAPILVVTGTNGKTTTVSVLHHMLRSAGVDAVLAGNVGTAFSGVVSEIRQDQVVVLEISSYQLEHAVGFAPLVGAILNVTPDHLERYGSFDAYVAAKRVLWEVLDAENGVAVANADDARLVTETRGLDRPVRWFGLDTTESNAATVVDGYVTLRKGSRERRLAAVKDIPLLGVHNVSNVLAAAACAADMTDNDAGLTEGIRTFTPVAHRLQTVRERDGVLYINDSKATNVSATATALAAMTRPTVLLMGGQGKGTGYSDLVNLIEEHVTHLIVYGQDAPRILEDLGDLVPVSEAETFEEAVQTATGVATPGSTVLLSPACASFDMFTNFEERGQRFAALVEAL